jgi:membrane associated rhomboid family serine protease
MPMIGASGAISAIVAAYAMLYGGSRTQGVGPLPAGLIHALWLGAAWTGINLLIGLTTMMGQPVAIGAHIGGFLIGLILARPLLLWRYRKA